MYRIARQMFEIPFFNVILPELIDRYNGKDYNKIALVKNFKITFSNDSEESIGENNIKIYKKNIKNLSETDVIEFIRKNKIDGDVMKFDNQSKSIMFDKFEEVDFPSILLLFNSTLDNNYLIAKKIFYNLTKNLHRKYWFSILNTLENDPKLFVQNCLGEDNYINGTEVIILIIIISIRIF